MRDNITDRNRQTHTQRQRVRDSNRERQTDRATRKELHFCFLKQKTNKTTEHSAKKTRRERRK